MSDTIIKAANLGKCYRIQHQAERQRYTTLRDVMAEKAKRFFKKLKTVKKESENRNVSVSVFPDPSVSKSEDFWALEDVSFEVKQGEVVGIIGRNGAGKSTLLKILSRITEPTKGRVHLKGRVASLLEVGTGFHPELTGRENIFLNGAILGMGRAEIRQKFDEIVAFAEVEKFLDTPVKRYSSGMYVRLAFAVAAHLEPEILIVDEVLAVGDAHFQAKCIGKMKDVSRGGRTVLFVSHNMAAISALCTSAMVMKKGTIVHVGPVNSCIEFYQGGLQGSQSTWERKSTPVNDSPVHFTSVALEIEGVQPSIVLKLDCRTESTKKHQPAFVAVDILDNTGAGIMQSIPSLEGLVNDAIQRNRFTISVNLPPLVPGHYLVTLWMGPHNAKTYDCVESAVGFEIAQSPTQGRTFPHTRDHGFIVPTSKISFEPER